MSVAEARERFGFKGGTLRRRYRDNILTTQVIKDGREYYLRAEVENMAEFTVRKLVAARSLDMTVRELLLWCTQTNELPFIFVNGRTHLFRPKDIEVLRSLLALYVRMGLVARQYGANSLNTAVQNGKIPSIGFSYSRYVLRSELEKYAPIADTYTSGEVAKRFGISVNKVAYLGNEGWLTYRTTINGRRRYTEQDIRNCGRLKP